MLLSSWDDYYNIFDQRVCCLLALLLPKKIQKQTFEEFAPLHWMWELYRGLNNVVIFASLKEIACVM